MNIYFERVGKARVSFDYQVFLCSAWKQLHWKLGKVLQNTNMASLILGVTY